MERFVAKWASLLPYDDEKLIVRWALDLIRIAPKFGRNIVAHPFSVHKLIPPFCPSQTCIASQFASHADISIVGTAMKRWDDCLAHITVGCNGEQCKTLVCGTTYVVVGLSDAKGTVVAYIAETCQEHRRFSHGERIGAMSMDSTGERLVTGGLKFIKIWDLKSGEIRVNFNNASGSRCLAVCFRSDNKKIVSISSD